MVINRLAYPHSIDGPAAAWTFLPDAQTGSDHGDARPCPGSRHTLDANRYHIPAIAVTVKRGRRDTAVSVSKRWADREYLSCWHRQRREHLSIGDRQSGRPQPRWTVS